MPQRWKNVFLYQSAVTVNLLAFTCGISFAWTSPVLPKLNENLTEWELYITPNEKSWIVALTPLGAIAGAIFSGPLADAIGQKKTLFALACSFLVSFLMLALSQKLVILYVARWIMGIGLGGVFVTLRMYLVEIAEDHNRGSIGSIMGVFLSCGLLFGYSIGSYFSISNFSLISCIPVVIFFVFFKTYMSESPQYLAAANKRDDLVACLYQLRNQNFSNATNEALLMIYLIQDENRTTNRLQQLFSLRKSTLISVILITFQQFSGYGVVFSYLHPIFVSTKTTLSPETSSIAIGIIQVFATFLTSIVSDRTGRKVLLVFGFLGCCISLTMLGTYFFLLDKKFQVSTISWIPLFSLVIFVTAYNIGLATTPWTVVTELFPNKVKSTALVLTNVIGFLAIFLSTFYFSSLVGALGMAQTFWVFAGICGVGCGFVVFAVPETKNWSLQEIETLSNS